MKPDNKCPKCGGEFEEGMLAAHGTRWVGRGLNMSATEVLGSIMPGKFSTTYRCKSCGYLESYAN